MQIFRLQHIILMALLTCVATTLAQDNDKILNRQYADMKRVHYGFSVGLNFQDLNITNNSLVTEDGQSWFADIPSHSPGFCVNVMADLKLHQHLNLRVAPGMYFGNKVVQFRNALGEPEAPEPSQWRQSQNIKATYIVLPIDLKISTLRYHNMRPYINMGVMPIYDVGKDRSEQLKLGNFDAMLTVGMGCDFYLPFFKLCPEVKFCFGLRNLLDKNRPDLQDNQEMMRFTESVSKIQNNMVVLTFYFE